MIDIHSHIIFCVDDGARNIEETKEILLDSYRQGVKTIIMTPHRRKNMFETPDSVIHTNFLKVKEIAKNISEELNVYLGSEIYYTIDVLEKLKNKEYMTLANTDYVLMEFNNHITFHDLSNALSSIIKIELTPIIAHVERYECLDKNKNGRVDELIDIGCLIQVNAANVLKPKLFGDVLKKYKRRVKYLLANNLVHFVASDVHNMTDRKNYMHEAYIAVKSKYGEGFAKKIFIQNQSKILRGEHL